MLRLYLSRRCRGGGRRKTARIARELELGALRALPPNDLDHPPSSSVLALLPPRASRLVSTRQSSRRLARPTRGASRSHSPPSLPLSFSSFASVVDRPSLSPPSPCRPDRLDLSHRPSLTATATCRPLLSRTRLRRRSTTTSRVDRRWLLILPRTSRSRTRPTPREGSRPPPSRIRPEASLTTSRPARVLRRRTTTTRSSRLASRPRVSRMGSRLRGMAMAAGQTSDARSRSSDQTGRG